MHQICANLLSADLKLGISAWVVRQDNLRGCLAAANLAAAQTSSTVSKVAVSLICPRL